VGPITAEELTEATQYGKNKKAPGYIGINIELTKYALATVNYRSSDLLNVYWSKLHTRKATEYVGMKQRSCRLSPTAHAGNTRNQPTCLCWTIRSVNPVRISLPFGCPLSQQNSRNYNSVKCTLSGKICFSYVGTIKSIASLQR
jgi:hypothetical protein